MLLNVSSSQLPEELNFNVTHHAVLPECNCSFSDAMLRAVQMFGFWQMFPNIYPDISTAIIHDSDGSEAIFNTFLNPTNLLNNQRKNSI